MKLFSFLAVGMVSLCSLVCAGCPKPTVSLVNQPAENTINLVAGMPIPLGIQYPKLTCLGTPDDDYTLAFRLFSEDNDLYIGHGGMYKGFLQLNMGSSEQNQSCVVAIEYRDDLSWHSLIEVKVQLNSFYSAHFSLNLPRPSNRLRLVLKSATTSNVYFLKDQLGLYLHLDYCSWPNGKQYQLTLC